MSHLQFMPANKVVLSPEQAFELQDSLEKAYSEPEFQQKLHKAFKSASNPAEESKARQELCLPIQTQVVAKFGFTADAKGVSASVRSFRAPDLQTEEILQQSFRLGVLVTPAMQDLEWVEKMGITESPLLKEDELAAAPETEQAPPPKEGTPGGTVVADLEEVTCTPLSDAGAFAGVPLEIYGLEGKIHPVGATTLFDQNTEPVEANGAHGQVLGYAFMEDLYVLQTADGLRLAVREENLRPFAVSLEDGGFDVSWPSNFVSAVEMESVLVQCLATKGFCVIQQDTSKDSSESAHASELQAALTGMGKAPRSFYQEEVEPMLGSQNSSTVFELEGEEIQAGDYGDALAAVNRDLTNLASRIASLVSDFCNLDLWGRTKNLLRVPSPAGQASQPVNPWAQGIQPVNTMGAQDVHLLQDYLEWLHSRKICMLYLMQNAGGYLEFTPYGGEPIRIPLKEKRLVVFRHDQMSYSYQPEGESVAIQTWLTTEPQSVKLIEMVQPPRPDGVVLHTMSAMERFPIGCYGTDKCFAMFAAGTDAQNPVQKTRFDMDLYYEDSDDTAQKFKSYTCHGALLEFDHAAMFDHKRFGYGPEELEVMGLQGRWCIETGYEALYKAGWTQETLVGEHIGTFTGDYVHDSYDTKMQQGLRDKYMVLNSDRYAFTAGRLSYQFGYRGPVCHCDTACSASMIAINAACNMMRGGNDGRQAALRNSLCLGVVAAIHPLGWISMCMGLMLSRQGRCFTFDASANGFIRGEGCAACVIQVADPGSQGSYDEKGRLNVVGGTASNQDGKSASLTAPSGPAQQETIRTSLKAGNINPLEPTIGDCHGTGTALGDPIEFGANKAVLGVKGREHPNVLVSSKAHLGHTEATAGICGFIKLTMMLLYQVTSPNPHIRVLNNHIDSGGYPVQFGSEAVDNGVSHAYGGLFSFGFGGSNTRADIWARAMKGHRKDIQISQIDYEALRMVQTVAEEDFMPKKPKLKLTPSH